MKTTDDLRERVIALLDDLDIYCDCEVGSDGYYGSTYVENRSEIVQKIVDLFQTKS